MVALNKEQEQMKEDKELLEKFRKKDNLISNKDLKHFNEQINENKKNFLSFLKEKDYLEKVDDENYKIKDDIFKKDGFEKILSDYEDETMYCFHTRENIFRGNLTDEELLERYDIKKEDFIIYSQNGDKLYDSESSLPTRDLEEYIIDIKNEEYWENLKLNDVKSWDNLLKENLVIGQMKSTEEEFDDYEEYTRNHLEEIANYTITEAKLIFGEVRQDLIRNSEKGLISEEKLEMLENRYSNFNEKEVKATEKDSRVKSEEYWLNKVENNKDKYKEEISNIKANFLSSFLKDNIPNYEKMSSAIELPKEDLKEKLNGNFNDYCLENYIWENDSLKEKIHNSFPLNEMVKRYGLEDELPDFKVTVDGFDFFNSKNNNEKLEEKLKEEKNINIKDIVEFSNHIKETFKNNDVEILFEKENGEYAKYNYGDYVENTYDELLDNIEEEAKVYRQAIKEEIDNITDKDGIVKEKDLKKVFDKYEISADYLFKNKEIKNVELEEKAPEKENTNNNEVKKKLNQYEKDLIKDIVDIFNGVDIFKDKEIKNIEAEEKTPKKEYTNNNELKEEIRSYQQDIIEAVVENEFEKISKNEYKLKDNTLLNKENWEKELKTDKYKDYNAFYIFDNTMTRTEMVERYDLDKKLSPFEIYTNDGDLLYNSASENNDFDKIREYAKENLANYDFDEFINEDLTKFENWQKVTTYDVGIGITELNGEKKQIYDVYDYTDPVYKELCQEIDKERVNFEEEIRLSFKEHIDNNIIKSDDLLKVFKKFDNGNDKRLERFEEKINDTEISTKEVGEKLKDREKDF